MMLTANRLRLALVGCCLFCWIAGCQTDNGRDEPEPAAPPTQPFAGGTAVIALPSEPDVLNPLIRTSAYAGQILAMTFDGLVEMNADLNWQPRVATRWQVAPDGLSITYHLQRWQWSDGQPLSAYDFASSFRLFKSAEVASVWRGFFRDVPRAVAVDSFTIRYEFDLTFSDPIARSYHGVLPEHVTRGLDPARVDSWPGNEQPLSCGPFVVQRWQRGRELVLARNTAYPGAPPLLDRVVFKFITDEMARTLALEVGEVDFLDEVPAQAVDRLATQPGVQLERIPGRDLGYLVWNLENPLFTDSRVRKAISLAVDRDRFVTGLLNGAGSPANGPLPPGLWNHHHDLPADPFRPDEARRLLAAAGWRDEDGDGILDRDGRHFSFELLARFGDPVRENGVVVIRENLRQVGIEVKTRLMEHATTLQRTHAGDFDAYLGLYAVNLYADPSSMVHSSAVDQDNVGRYHNAVVDSLLAVALRIADREAARPVWFRLQEELAADLPMAFLYFPEVVVGFSTRLQNVRPHMLSPYENVDRWWIAPSDRKYRSSKPD